MILSDRFIRNTKLDNLPMDVESLWNDLPDMSKDMVLKWAGRHNFDIQLEGTQILLYFPSLFVHDKNYHWNLWKTKRTSCVLAADLWLKGKNNEALLMVFYAAAVEECLARGLDVVTKYLSSKISKVEHHTDWNWKSWTGTHFDFETMYSYFAFLQRALVSTRSGKDMHEYLLKKLRELPGTNKWIGMMSRMKRMPATVHKCNNPCIMEVVPQEVMTLKCLATDNSILFEMAVYEDTIFNWVFNMVFIAHGICAFPILQGSGCRIKPGKMRDLRFPHLQWCRFDYGKKLYCPRRKRLYLITNNTKTLGGLGMKDGAMFILRSLRDKEVAAPNCTNIKATSKAKKEGEAVLKLGSRRKSKEKNEKKSTKQLPDYLKCEAADEYTLREAHSKAMEPVLNELRPRLKSIRDKLSALSLKKKLPKTRVEKKVKPEANDAHLMPLSANNDLGGKAGKSVYPVLVGDVNNLYNTSILKSLPPQKVITLDLHSCSWYKAKGVLRKNLEKWIDLAMKGEHPFVIRVDIVCGGGNQVLSELVASFIRDSPQVANRPKRRR